MKNIFLLQSYAKPNLLLLLFSIFLAAIFFACDKEEVTPEIEEEVVISSCEENATELNFFNYTFMSNRNQHLIGDKIYATGQEELIKEKLADIRADNCRERFVKGVVATLGFLIWDRATVGKKTNGDAVIYTATAHPNADSITSILIAEKDKDFIYYRLIKKDILEVLQKQQSNELLSQLQFIEDVDKELFGEKVREDDDLDLLEDLEENPIESRCGTIEIVTCKPYALRGDIIEQRSCPAGTLEIIEYHYIPCGNGDSGLPDSGVGDDNPCSFCDGDFDIGDNGGSNGNDGNDNDDGPSDDVFDDNGDPIDDPEFPCVWEDILATEKPLGGLIRTCKFLGRTTAGGAGCNPNAYILPPEGWCTDYVLEQDNSTAVCAGGQNFDVWYSGSYLSGVQGEVGETVVIGTFIGVRKYINPENSKTTYFFTPSSECYYDCIDCY